jgi:prepilin peptidase CpaA
VDVATTVLILHVGLAAVWDLAQRRIPNWLVVSGLLLGFAFQAQSSGFAGLGSSVLGAAVALVTLIGPFALRWMGGGDVKISMVCGAFLGWSGALHVILVGTVAHGVLGIGVLGSRMVKRSMGRETDSPAKLPHALGFAVSTVLYTAGIGRLF